MTCGIWWQVSWRFGPPQNWPNVSATPGMIEKALQVVGETLEKLSTWVATGAVGWMFLSAL